LGFKLHGRTLGATVAVHREAAWASCSNPDPIGLIGVGLGVVRIGARSIKFDASRQEIIAKLVDISVEGKKAQLALAVVDNIDDEASETRSRSTLLP
jgi:hypothetical protein